MKHAPKKFRTLFLCHGALCAALAILLLSYAVHRAIPALHPPAEWQVHHFDQGDYRFVAEYFWHVPFQPETYGEDFTDQWGAYLKRVPVRDIGLGTVLIAYRMFTRPFSGEAWHDPVSSASGFVAFTHLGLVLSSLLLFSVIKRRFGMKIALFSFALIVFIPSLWSMGDEFLTEPWIRSLFFILLAIVLSDPQMKRPDRLAFGIAAVLMILIELKVQWILLTAPLALAFFTLVWPKKLHRDEWLGMGAALLAVPLSIAAVHAIGWGNPTISPGIGLHVNFEQRGALYRRFCDDSENAARPFCDLALQKIGWWDVPLGPEVPLTDFMAFDRFARADILSHPQSTAQKFFDGLRLATNFPVDSASIGGVSVRWFWNIVDALCWMLLLAGLFPKRTRLLAAFGLGLWVVPAVGQMISAYDLRYHVPMAGIVLVIAVFIAIELWRGRDHVASKRILQKIRS